MSVVVLVLLGLVVLAIPFIFVVALVLAAVRRRSGSRRPGVTAYRGRPHAGSTYSSTPYHYYGDTGSSDSSCNDSGNWGNDSGSSSSGDSGSSWSSDSGGSSWGGDSGGFSGGGDSGSSSC